MSWSAVHANGVITEEGTDFAVQHSPGHVKVKATSQLTGNLHFPIPSVPASYSNITSVTVDFQAEGATVDSIRVFLGKTSHPAGSDLDWTETETSSVSPTLSVKSNSAGIDVVLGVKFDGTGSDSYLTIHSVGVSYN